MTKHQSLNDSYNQSLLKVYENYIKLRFNENKNAIQAGWRKGNAFNH